jgi:hypothetical protein
MKVFRLVGTLAAAALLAACATVETPSRNAPFAGAAASSAGIDPAAPIFQAALASFNVQQVNVIVPQDLLVSEANRYYPRGDIVWRGDPAGDRHEQVKAIFEDGITRGASQLKGDVPVIVDIQVMRFHSLTEKTRYTIGGIHSIKFGLSIRSAETGLLMAERRVIKADLKGFGGQQAINAERQGQTQKVRITAHLASVIQTELKRTN